MNAVVAPGPVAAPAGAATAAPTPSITPASSLDRARLRDLREMVEEFHCEYAGVLDRGEVEAWPAFFTEDAYYRVIARDNLESGLPLGLMLCEGMGMLKDRAFAIAHTEMFAPRYVQHHISLIRITGIESGAEEIIHAEGNYLVYETLIDEPTELLQAGKYRDQFVLREGRLLLKSRECVFDSVMVPNCVVYPV
jgi:3-phenylpropionate/cinnamic acid dioxygenase small subunit